LAWVAADVSPLKLKMSRLTLAATKLQSAGFGLRFFIFHTKGFVDVATLGGKTSAWQNLN